MQPFNVYQHSRLLFVVHARSITQARAIVAAMVAGEVNIVPVAGARQ